MCDYWVSTLICSNHISHPTFFKANYFHPILFTLAMMISKEGWTFYFVGAIGDEDTYGVEMSTFLNKDDVLKPGHKNGQEGGILRFCTQLRQKGENNGNTKRTDQVEKGKAGRKRKMLSAQLPEMSSPEEELDTDDELPAFGGMMTDREKKVKKKKKKKRKKDVVEEDVVEIDSDFEAGPVAVPSHVGNNNHVGTADMAESTLSSHVGTADMAERTLLGHVGATDKSESTLSSHVGTADKGESTLSSHVSTTDKAESALTSCVPKNAECVIVRKTGKKKVATKLFSDDKKCANENSDVENKKENDKDCERVEKRRKRKRRSTGDNSLIEVIKVVNDVEDFEGFDNTAADTEQPVQSIMENSEAYIRKENEGISTENAKENSVNMEQESDCDEDNVAVVSDVEMEIIAETEFDAEIEDDQSGTKDDSHSQDPQLSVLFPSFTPHKHIHNTISQRQSQMSVCQVKTPPSLEELAETMEEFDCKGRLSPVDILELVDLWESEKTGQITDHSMSFEKSMPNKSKLTAQNSSTLKKIKVSVPKIDIKVTGPTRTISVQEATQLNRQSTPMNNVSVSARRTIDIQEATQSDRQSTATSNVQMSLVGAGDIKGDGENNREMDEYDMCGFDSTFEPFESYKDTRKVAGKSQSKVCGYTKGNVSDSYDRTCDNKSNDLCDIRTTSDSDEYTPANCSTDVSKVNKAKCAFPQVEERPWGVSDGSGSDSDVSTGSVVFEAPSQMNKSRMDKDVCLLSPFPTKPHTLIPSNTSTPIVASNKARTLIPDNTRTPALGLTKARTLIPDNTRTPAVGLPKARTLIPNITSTPLAHATKPISSSSGEHQSFFDNDDTLFAAMLTPWPSTSKQNESVRGGRSNDSSLWTFTQCLAAVHTSMDSNSEPSMTNSEDTDKMLNSPSSSQTVEQEVQEPRPLDVDPGQGQSGKQKEVGQAVSEMAVQNNVLADVCISASINMSTKVNLVCEENLVKDRKSERNNREAADSVIPNQGLEDAANMSSVEEEEPQFDLGFDLDDFDDDMVIPPSPEAYCTQPFSQKVLSAKPNSGICSVFKRQSQHSQQKVQSSQMENVSFEQKMQSSQLELQSSQNKISEKQSSQLQVQSLHRKNPNPQQKRLQQEAMSSQFKPVESLHNIRNGNKANKQISVDHMVNTEVSYDLLNFDFDEPFDTGTEREEADDNGSISPSLLEPVNNLRELSLQKHATKSSMEKHNDGLWPHQKTTLSSSTNIITIQQQHRQQELENNRKETVSPVFGSSQKKKPTKKLQLKQQSDPEKNNINSSVKIITENKGKLDPEKPTTKDTIVEFDFLEAPMAPRRSQSPPVAVVTPIPVVCPGTSSMKDSAINGSSLQLGIDIGQIDWNETMHQREEETNQSEEKQGKDEYIDQSEEKHGKDVYTDQSEEKQGKDVYTDQSEEEQSKHVCTDQSEEEQDKAVCEEQHVGRFFYQMILCCLYL